MRLHTTTVNYDVVLCIIKGMIVDVRILGSYDLPMARTPTAKNDPLGIRLEPEEREALERAARHDDRPLSAMGRKAIVSWLREHGWMPPVNDKGETS